MKNISFSRADISDHTILSTIAFQAKKHWGYPDSWLELWKQDLTITEKYIVENQVFKVLYDKDIIGFTGISTDLANKSLEIDHMWILPSYMGKGLGEKLFNYAIRDIKSSNSTKILVVSDPNAIGFYKKLGFTSIGEVQSTPKGRTLPLLEKPF